MRAVWLVVFVGGVALAAPPSLSWEGKLVWTPPAELIPSQKLGLGLTWAGWEWAGKAEVEEGVWRFLTLSGTRKFEFLTLSPGLSFDPKVPKFEAFTLPWKLALHGLTLEGVARLEEKGFGWGLTLLGPKDAFLEQLRLRFNLKRFLDEVLEETFTPSFSFGQVRFRVALPCCVTRLRAWLDFTKAGFSELGLSFPLPFPREALLSFVGIVRLSLERKSVYLAPSFFYELPPCVVAFLGLDWDQATWTIKGIRVYAVGFRCELGEMEVRGLTALEDIGLVPRPYREALWVSWKGEGCCGPARFGAALYFGEEGLFGLGRADVGAELPLAPGVTVGLGAELPKADVPKLVLSWRVNL